MTVETEVATLTTAVDNLTSAVNVSKATLDASVVNAQSAETGAIAASGTASGFSTAAAAHKDQAYTYSQSAASAVTYQDLTAIAASKSVTAVDVFVYDTSKDSDGGAWRKRTQGTSWYNETLNTSTRGSRKEFPAVAVIVAEARKITVYDGDDPSMPMWMVFNGGSDWDILLPTYTSGISSIAAGQGLIWVGDKSGGGYGLSNVSFITDVGYNYATGVSKKFNNNILNRNTNNDVGTAVADIGVIVNIVVNDIAMTVLPNAPIDSATGLPIPTIAVATDGGVSVIKDDGSVVDMYPPSGTSNVRYVSFSDDHKVVWNTDFSASAGGRYLKIHDIPSSDLALTFGSTDYSFRVYDPNNLPSIKGASSNSYYHPIDPILHKGVLSVGFKTGYASKWHGLTKVKLADTQANDSVALITSDYNTGYMVGDIKLAALSDTDDTDVVGSELFSGDAASDDTNSVGIFTTVNNGTISVNTNTAYTDGDVYSVNIIATGSGSGGSYFKTGVCIIGLTYTMSLKVIASNGSASSKVQIYTGSTNGGTQYNTQDGFCAIADTWDSHSVTFTATTTDLSVKFLEQGSGNNTNFFVDSLSVRLADTDRSVNANGLAVHGTITKNPVATGADLVGYSGFTTSNYLEQPYNSDLDFGTGDFSIMGWFKINTSTATTQYMLARGTHTKIGVNLVQDDVAFYVGGTAFLVAGIPLTTWHFGTFYRKDGVAYVALNGVEKISGASTSNVSGTTPTLTLGIRDDAVLPLTTASLTNWRISATAPSAQQIKDIYEAEKPLFQENAQATLYGTSDAVTALAHDSDTNLLHVGTSAGRSVFQGLQRVSNTTTAVGTAISASNNLIVEE